MKKSLLTLLFLGIFCAFSNYSIAQCVANFNYTLGANGSVTFSSTSVGTSSTTQYYWNFDDGATASFNGIPTANHVYSYNQLYNVTLTINDSINNQSCWASVTKTVLVSNSLCNGSLTFSTYEGSNGHVSFNNTSVGISPQANYTFSFGDGSSQVSWPVAGHTYSAAGVYTINVVAAGAGCTYTAVQTLTVNYYLCPLNASFVYTVGTNGLVSFASTSTGTTSAANMSWNFGDGTGGFGSTTTHQYLTSGSYNVLLTVNDSINVSCSDTVSQTITLNNVCYASASFVMWKDSTQMPNIVWNAYPTYPANISVAQWNWGDGSSTVGLYPSHTYSATGVYNICLSVTVSCGSTATTCVSSNIFKQMDNSSMQMASVSIVNSPPNAVKKNKVELNATVYPNPSDGNFTIDLSNTKGFVTVEVYSLMGEKIFTAQADHFQTSIDLSDKPAGWYLLRVADGNRTFNRKIAIHR